MGMCAEVTIDLDNPNVNPWEKFAIQLLQKRHGPHNVQRIPSETEGDGGVDLIVLDKGLIYQLYASDHTEGQAHYEAVRDKVTRDIGKLDKNKKEIAKLLGNKKISQWILFIPICRDKRVIAHLRKKEEEVKNKNLPFLSIDFRTQITWLVDFDNEREAIKKSANTAPIFDGPWAQLVWDSPLWPSDCDENLKYNLARWAELSFAKVSSIDENHVNVWRDEMWAERTLEHVGNLTEKTSLEWSAQEAALLLIAPIWRQTALMLAEQAGLDDAMITDTNIYSTPNAARRIYQTYLERRPQLVRKLSRLHGLDHSDDMHAVAWWLWHHALLASPQNWTLEGPSSLLPKEWRNETKALLLQIDSDNEIFKDHPSCLKHKDRIASFPDSPCEDFVSQDGFPVNIALSKDGPTRLHSLAYILSFSGRLALDPLSLNEVLVDHIGLSQSIDPGDVVRATKEAKWVQIKESNYDLLLTCNHPAIDSALEQRVTGPDGLIELSQILERALMDPDSPAKDLEKIPHFHNKGLQPKTDEKNQPLYRRPHLRFTLAQDEVRELLMGEQLYGDPNLAFREMYQNALDACRLKEIRLLAHLYVEKVENGEKGWEASAKGRRPGKDKDMIPAGDMATLEEKQAIKDHFDWEGKIEFIQDRDENGHYIECLDNGIGMSESELRKCFAKAGRRFANTEEYVYEANRWRDLGIGHYPNSQFGIGVFSYFMLAEEIKLQTCRMGLKDPYDKDDTLNVSIAGSGSLFHLRPNAGPLRGGQTGTKLHLNLSKTTWKKGEDISVIKALNKWLMIAEFATSVDDKIQGVSQTWESNVLNYKGATIATDNPDIYWANHKNSWKKGLYLADGITTGNKHDCLLVNLRGRRYPVLSIDRKKILKKDDTWIAHEILQHGWRVLLDTPLQSLKVCWAAAKRFPLAMNHWLENEKDDVDVSIDISGKDFHVSNVYNLKKWGVLFQDLALMENISDYMNNDDFITAWVETTPWHRARLKKAFDLDITGNTQEEISERFQENELESQHGLAKYPLIKDQTSEIIYIGPLIGCFFNNKEFSILKLYQISLGDVVKAWDHLKNTKPDWFQMPNIQEDTIAALQCLAQNEVELFAHDFDLDEPQLTGPVSASHLLRASRKVDWSLWKTYKHFERFSTFGFTLPPLSKNEIKENEKAWQDSLFLLSKTFNLDDDDWLTDKGTPHHILKASVEIKATVYDVFQRLKIFETLGLSLPDVDANTLKSLPATSVDDVCILKPFYFSGDDTILSCFELMHNAKDTDLTLREAWARAKLFEPLGFKLPSEEELLKFMKANDIPE